jgi:hypothetical protein
MGRPTVVLLENLGELSLWLAKPKTKHIQMILISGRVRVRLKKIGDYQLSAPNIYFTNKSNKLSRIPINLPGSQYKKIYTNNTIPLYRFFYYLDAARILCEAREVSTIADIG